MKKDNKFLNKLLASLKEFVRKFLVTLKKNPSLIPLAMLMVSFLVFSLNLTAISNTTARIQGEGMGLCEFTAMLLSLLSMICLLKAYPKRQKPKYAMIAITLVFIALIVVSDITYISRITTSAVKLTSSTMFIYTAQTVLSAHIVLVIITAVTVVLEPLFAKLLKKINTNIEIETTEVSDIELAQEE